MQNSPYLYGPHGGTTKMMESAAINYVIRFYYDPRPAVNNRLEDRRRCATSRCGGKAAKLGLLGHLHGSLLLSFAASRAWEYIFTTHYAFDCL
jgi:hypothetical protein